MDARRYTVATPLLAEADAEAQQLGHSFVGPEHLLIAVAAHPNAASRSFLDRYGLTAAVLRESVVTELGPIATSPTSDNPRAIALRSVVALGHAVAAGRGRSEPTVYRPDDLLLGLFADDVASHAVIGAVLSRFGLTPAAARAEVAELRSHDAGT